MRMTAATTLTDVLPLETYRGCCNAWECDENGHMNVRFYVQRAMEGLVSVAGALGLSDAFKSRANATLIPIEQHIRFLREAPPGAPLSQHGGVLSHAESSALVYQELRHGDGGLAAATTTLLAHADPKSGRAFSWPARVADRWAALQAVRPNHGAPRGLNPDRAPGEATMALADALGAPAIGRGAFAATDIDVFGRMRAEIAIGRISDSAPNLLAEWRALAARDVGAKDVGGAVVEYRIFYRRWPRSGDQFVVRSAVTAVLEKAIQVTHWILDPITGEAWASAEVVALTFDLSTRRVITPSEQARALLERQSIPGMTL